MQLQILKEENQVEVFQSTIQDLIIQEIKVLMLCQNLTYRKIRTLKLKFIIKLFDQCQFQMLIQIIMVLRRLIIDKTHRK